MTTGQTRVLVLLGVLLGVQALFNPNIARILTGHLNPTQQQGGALGLPGVVIAGYVGTGAAAVALVALAAPAPNLATWIVVLFIVMALLEHPQGWSAALGAATAGVSQLTGGNLSGNTSSSGASDPANRTA